MENEEEDNFLIMQAEEIIYKRRSQLAAANMLKLLFLDHFQRATILSYSYSQCV
mgnify:CR=1 FL=1